jgi:hypothetical protein
MAYDGNDRFRNWSHHEYESKIQKLEAQIGFLKSDVIIANEQKDALSRRLKERLAHSDLTA